MRVANNDTVKTCRPSSDGPLPEGIGSGKKYAGILRILPSVLQLLHVVDFSFWFPPVDSFIFVRGGFFSPSWS